MEIKLHAEIRNYSESVFFGLSMRQFFCSVLAVIASVIVYFSVNPVLESTLTGLLCIAAASPFAAVGFLKINGMSADKYALAMLRYARSPKKLPYRSTNALYDELKKRGVIDP